MQTIVHDRFRGTREAAVAESVLGACVHCGFCNATCPTYLDLGDAQVVANSPELYQDSFYSSK